LGKIPALKLFERLRHYLVKYLKEILK
jgi:hypothetical protein